MKTDGGRGAADVAGPKRRPGIEDPCRQAPIEKLGGAGAIVAEPDTRRRLGGDAGKAQFGIIKHDPIGRQRFVDPSTQRARAATV